MPQSSVPPSWELIVVDDASGDDTAMVARRFADHVITLPGPGAAGPAAARNAGAAVARGEILVFVDADVRVRPDAVARLVGALTEDPTLGAAFGSYDATPARHSVCSRYRNLLHHYVHQHGAGLAETFWAGCGAVRRDAFLEAGGFDARRYRRPQIEDIALGYRMRDLGHRIRLVPEAQGTHLKAWTLTGILRTDVVDRGIPWMRLLLERGRPHTPPHLNVSPAAAGQAVAVCLAGLGLGAGLVGGPAPLPAVSALLLVAVIGGNRHFYRWLAARHGWGFALRCIPLHLAHHGLNGVSAALGSLAYLLTTLRTACVRRSVATEGRP
ncbi:MAG: glycosyltransferase family 2 protein [Vicinamibacterales bacterium]